MGALQDNIEENYTKIPNEILEFIALSRLPRECIKVLFSIIRKTWGWNKPCESISMGEIADLTGLKRQNVLRARNKLVELNILQVTLSIRKNQLSNYQINPKVKTWKDDLEKSKVSSREMTNVIATDDSESKKVSSPEMTSVITDDYSKQQEVSSQEITAVITTDDTAVISCDSPSIKRKIKDTFIKENVASPSKLQPIHHELTEFLIQRILAREPTNRLNKKNYQSSARRKWPEDFEKMIRLDSRAPPEIREMIEWVTNHTFWAANVLSARKLREKWDALKIQKTSEERSGKNKSTDCKIIEHWDELDNFDPSKPSEISDFFQGHESDFVEHPGPETEQ